MTLVRRHLVAAISLVLALATGIALGAGPLSREALLPTRAETGTPATPEDRSADELAEAVAPTVAGERLAGTSVTVLSTPGAAGRHVDALVADVERAGGSITARWRLGRSLVATGEAALVDTLGEQLLEQLGRDGADAEAPAYVRMGRLLAAAVATRDERPETAQDDAVTIRQSLDAASLLTADDEDPRLAPLVVVVLGDDVEDAVVEGLTTGLGERSARVVVTGDEGAADVRAAAESKVVWTVDGVGGAAGRLAAVLALSAPAKEPPGSYGASGTDGVLPLG